MRANAVVLGGVNGERAPAATYVEKCLIWLEPQLATNHVELVALRSREVVVRLGEKGAAVDHLGIEKERIEFVRKIVVILNVFLVGPLASVAVREVAAYSFERPWSAARDEQEARCSLEHQMSCPAP